MPDAITKFIASLDERTRQRLKGRLLALKQDPYNAHDVKKMSGQGGHMYRLRVGKIRITYILKDTELEILDIDYRGNIYNK